MIEGKDGWVRDVRDAIKTTGWLVTVLFICLIAFVFRNEDNNI